MFKGDWIKSVAFVALPLVILAIGALYGKSKWEQYATDRYAAATEYDEDVKARVSICREPDSFIAFLSCAYEASNPDQGDYTSQKDLRAQQDMSIWAFGMFVAAVATLFVTAFGVFFVWLTLKKADETNQAAIKAANAATEANEIMRSEQRPWLSCEIDLFGFDDGKGIKPVCDFTIHNYGKRPGFDAIVMVRPVQYYVWQDVRDVIKDVKEGLNLDRRTDFPVVYPGVPLPKPQTHTQIGGMLGYRGPQLALISVLAYRVARESKSRDGMEIRAYDVLRQRDTPNGHRGRIEEHEDGFVL